MNAESKSFCFALLAPTRARTHTHTHTHTQHFCKNRVTLRMYFSIIIYIYIVLNKL